MKLITLSPHLLLLLIVVSITSSTHAIPSASLTTRDVSPFTTGLAAITASVKDLDARILSYPGGDISNITTGAAALITLLLAETKAIQSDFLNATEAATLLPSLENLAGQFATVVQDYIAIHDAIAVADEGWYIYSQLQEEHTAALTYTGSVVARIPAGDVKDAAAGWATDLTDSLEAGRDAYKDIAVRPTGYARV
ncbi:uncharacterized protein BP01DRAFT_354007 [Aspergillus saccharolyticus JOP 1030-1]|uniref:Hydrophobic surface binding protein A n=1 Tax=Aspergillus saccharolyticus JOP 1030-1 TaxID=1450539 RepID=A0A318ZNR4_9EURO|nr:hypothetical protein BP01DRAFT_354007 [Aspergillus saccharolyticus JOP 1030-1]PYH48164.1 hypothetical protein BP01DRAFT_354007 [Aspergillus saccharolyticus JOP 1030-1]